MRASTAWPRISFVFEALQGDVLGLLATQGCTHGRMADLLYRRQLFTGKYVPSLEKPVCPRAWCLGHV